MFTSTVWAFPPKPENVKWHPGHYYEVDSARKYDPAFLDEVYNELQNTPALRGLAIKYTWSELETSEGVYNLKHINAQLDRLRLMRKRLIIIIRTKSFNIDEVPVPSYITTNPIYKGGVFLYGANSTVPKGYNVKLWETSVRYRLAQLVKGLGAKLNHRSIVEGIGFSESTPGTAIAPAPPITDDLIITYFNNLARLQQRMREAFPNTVTFQFTNYPRWALIDFIPRLLGVGGGLGCPDIFPDDAGLNAIASLPDDPKVTSPGVYQYYRQLAGQMPLVIQVEKSNYENTAYNGSGHTPTVNELLTYGRDNLKVNYILWQKTIKSLDQALLEELNHPDNNSNPEGGLSSACPTNFGSCI